MDYEQTRTDFVFRRAYRHGQVRSDDLVKAFGINIRTAERHIKTALEDPRNLLVRQSRSWVSVAPHALATPPEVASEKDLLKFLRLPETSDSQAIGNENKQDLLFFQLTGLRSSELSLTRANWLNNAPMQPGILTNIVRALQSDHSVGLEISYIGLGRGETAERGWQRIIPLSLQVIGEQYSLYALRYAKLDVEQRKWHIAGPAEAVTRTFVLSRIAEAKPDPNFKPRSYRIPHSQEANSSEAFLLDPSLTADQKAMVRHELKMIDDTVTLPESRMFQFKRFYSDLAASAQAIWPLLHINPKK